jgi:hypothetical protein
LRFPRNEGVHGSNPGVGFLWVVTGEEKRVALQKLVSQDPSTTSGRVEPGGDSLILADRAAAPDS